jgi:hypothetical protein
VTEAFSFAHLEQDLARSAREGAAEAAGQLAQVLRTKGETVSVQAAPDGTAQIILEGAATVAREFGTQNVSAQPVAATALQTNRQSIRDTIDRKLAEAMKRVRS